MSDSTRLSFNLVEESWLRCHGLDGSLVELGLRDTLARAHELADLAETSPLVSVSLHRLLLAVLHRTLGPPTLQDWASLYERKRFDMALIGTHLDEWSRGGYFDLFDSKRPFYQTLSLELADKYVKPIAKLRHEQTSGNNPTLFDHTYEARPGMLVPAEAARLVVTQQAFSTGGTQTRDDPQHASASPAPLVNSAVLLFQGTNLFETLMLNLVVYDGDEKPFHASGKDRPAWERDEPVMPRERVPTGYLDLLTWQSRRIRLRATRDTSGALAVTGVVIMKGERFPKEWKVALRETMVAYRIAYRIRNRVKSTEEPYSPIGFTRDRSAWRDSLAFLEGVPLTQRQDGIIRPKVMDHMIRLVSKGLLPRHVYSLTLRGLRTDEQKIGKVVLWREERLALPSEYLDDACRPHLILALHDALNLAEHTAYALSSALRVLATELSPRPAQDERTRVPPDKKTIEAIRKSFQGERRYWARLDVAFPDLLKDLPTDLAKEGDSFLSDSLAMRTWRRAVRDAAINSLEEVINGIDRSREAIRAGALAQQQLTRWLRWRQEAPAEQPLLGKEAGIE
jgi:CRISPR system Cascade subunit CasA